MAGFYCTMKEEKTLELKEHMLDYAIALLEDANDSSWGAAKASHAVLLCRMKQGEVSDFSDIQKIDRIQRANAQKHPIVLPHKMPFQRNLVEKILGQCPAITTTKILVFMIKHMKQKVLFTNIYAQHALQMGEKVSHI